MWGFPLFPEQASTMARQVDELYLFELVVSRLRHGLDLRAHHHVRGPLPARRPRSTGPARRPPTYRSK